MHLRQTEMKNRKNGSAPKNIQMVHSIVEPSLGGWSHLCAVCIDNGFGLRGISEYRLHCLHDELEWENDVVYYSQFHSIPRQFTLFSLVRKQNDEIIFNNSLEIERVVTTRRADSKSRNV